MANSRNKKKPTPVPPSRTNTFGLPVEPVGVDASRIDPRYHRTNSQRRVAKFASDPDPIRAPYCTYNRRADGSLIQIDGDATRAAAEANGYKYVYGRILDQLSFEDEITLYLELNSNVSGYNRHIANVARKEAISLRMEKVLAAEGLSASPRKNTGSIRAIDVFRSCWGKAGKWKDTSQLTKTQLDKGETCMRWVIRSLKGLVKKGDSAWDVYTVVNVSALTWLYHNSSKRPTAAQLSRILAQGTAKTLQMRLPDEHRSARMRYGLRLDKLIEELVGQSVFELNIEKA